MSNPRMSEPNTSDPNTSEANASNPGAPESTPAAEPTESSPAESFKDIFSEYEQSHSRKSEAGNQRREGTVIAVTADSAVLDIGFKTECVLRRTAISIKQLQPHPWDAVAEKYKAGERVHGTITRLTDYGAFVDLDPGIEGLIH